MLEQKWMDALNFYIICFELSVFGLMLLPLPGLQTKQAGIVRPDAVPDCTAPWELFLWHHGERVDLTQETTGKKSLPGVTFFSADIPIAG